MTNQLIQILPSEVVDQIAAGEVVERPAHMVKELIENALDAGSGEIEVEFSEGGRNVRVRDNGGGIEKNQLALALARHATSKIKLASDIWSLASYGFRGEALATISAVSRLKILSRTPNTSQASALTSEFGHVGGIMDMGGEFGTTIEVKDLFANTPARLKFLKSDGAEALQIKQVVKSLALANPQVSIRLKIDKKLIWHWPAQESFQSRVEQILELNPLFSGKGADGDYVAEVVLAPPTVVERTSRQIWIMVQGRVVQDRGLQAAVTEGFRSLLMHGEYPICVVSLRVPPDQVDVNIHPTKSAVKFQDSSRAFKAVHRAVRSLLERAPWHREVVTPASEVSMNVSPVYRDLTPKKSFEFVGPEFAKVQYASKEFPVRLKEIKNLAPEIKSGVQVQSTKVVYESNDLDLALRQPIEKVQESSAHTRKPYWRHFDVIGQVHQTYIVAQSADEMLLIDQHAAHERVAYEKLMSAWLGGFVDVQPFLLPVQIQLDVELTEALLKQKNELIKLGVEIESLGPQIVGVRAAPTLIKETALVKALSKLAHEAAQHGDSFAVEKLISDICATLACHSVVRAGQVLSVEEMKSLLEQMDEFSFSSFCPHGRPVSISMPWAKIERDFGRIN